MRYSRATIAAAAAVLALPLALNSCVFPSPSPGVNAQLNAVASVNAADSVAVGHFADGTGEHELIEQWNGRTWQEVFLPPPIGHGLNDVTAVNAQNVWAVGNLRTLHFGGLGWHSIPNPAGVSMVSVSSTPDGAVYGLGDKANNRQDIYTMSPVGWQPFSTIPSVTAQGCGSLNVTDLALVGISDVWIVGNGTESGSGTGCTFGLHFNAGAWHSAATPAVAGSSLAAVSARGDNDVWAVGETVTHDQSLDATFDSTYFLHWNGTTWSQVSGTGGGSMNDVVATPEGIWAVGTSEIGAGFPLGMQIAKWNGKGMVSQPVQDLSIPGTISNESQLSGVSVAGGVVTSVGSYAPRINVTATLTERRNAS